MKTINDIKNAVLSGNRVFWKTDDYEVIKSFKTNEWLLAFRRGQRGENYVGLTHRDGVGTEYDPKDFYIKGKSVNMKVEDKFYGKRVVKGIFAKAKFSMVGDIVKVRQGHKSVKGEIVKDNGDGTYMIELPNQLYSDGRKIIERVSEARLLLSRTGAKARFANEEIAKGLSKVLKANGFDAMASEVLSGSTDSETLRKYIRALKSKISPMSGNDRGMVLLQTLEKQLASRTGVKAKFANGGTKTAAFLAKIDNKSKAMILENIAKNYGISAQAALAEITDSESENLLDYMTEPARSAASVLMQKYRSFNRAGIKAFK
jgi:hypothetical protein